MHASNAIQYFVVSLCEGNIDLTQRVWYQVDHIQTTSVPQNIVVESPVHKPATTALAPNVKRANHCNLNIEYLPNGGGVRKYREDIVIIPCVEEFSVRGRFYTLNKQSLSRALRDEDFLLRVDIDVKASCSLDILDMFFISDQNISERPYIKQRKKFGFSHTKGQKLRDIKMLRPLHNTAHWLRQTDVHQSAGQPKSIAWHRRESVPRISLVDPPPHVSPTTKKEDPFKTNLLSKIPINSTIIDSSSTAMSSSLVMNRSAIDGKSNSDVGTTFHESNSVNDLMGVAVVDNPTVRALVKIVYNKAIDSFVLTDHCKGFLKEKAIAESSGMSWPVFGVYCIRWRRTGSRDENESKFVIQGIGE